MGMQPGLVVDMHPVASLVFEFSPFCFYRGTDRQTDRQTDTHRQALADQGSVMCRLGSAIASLTLERVKEGAFVRRLAMAIKYCQNDDRPKLSPNEA